MGWSAGGSGFGGRLVVGGVRGGEEVWCGRLRRKGGGFL